jgi:ribokinase
VDTTGAGDAFAAALTVALAEGQSEADALEFACAVGALTTTRLGTQTASPTRAEVDKLLGR